jgi:hypothetical protein
VGYLTTKPDNPSSRVHEAILLTDVKLLTSQLCHLLKELKIITCIAQKVIEGGTWLAGNVADYF